jgi:hypothetical protein
MVEKKSEMEKDTIGKVLENWQMKIKGVKGEAVNYYVMWYDKDDSMQLRKAKVDKDIGEGFVKSLKKSIQDLTDQSLVNYKDSDSAGNDYQEIISQTEVPNAMTLIKGIQDCRNNMKLEDIKKRSGLKFIVKAENFYGFGQVKKEEKMKQKNGLFHLRFSSDRRFSGIEPSTEFIIPEKMDAIMHDGQIIIWNEYQFESIFHYHAKILEKIKSRRTESDSLFSDSEEFEKAVESDSSKARKVYSVYTDSNFNNLTVDKMMKYAKDYSLDIVKDQQNTSRISFSGSTHWHVIKAMSEDYYTGYFSGNKWASNKKRKVK